MVYNLELQRRNGGLWDTRRRRRLSDSTSRILSGGQITHKEYCGSSGGCATLVKWQQTHWYLLKACFINFFFFCIFFFSKNKKQKRRIKCCCRNPSADIHLTEESCCVRGLPQTLCAAAFRDQNKKRRPAKLLQNARPCGEELCVFVDITSDIDDLIPWVEDVGLGWTSVETYRLKRAGFYWVKPAFRHTILNTKTITMCTSQHAATAKCNSK